MYILTNDVVFFTVVIVEYMKRKPKITKPRYSEQILPVSWPFVIQRSTVYRGFVISRIDSEVKKIVLYTNDFVQ